MTKREKEEPIPGVVRADMQAIASAIEKTLPKSHGFALLVFDYGEGGRMSYISNARREDMHEALRELLGKWDADATAKMS